MQHSRLKAVRKQHGEDEKLSQTVVNVAIRFSSRGLVWGNGGSRSRLV